MSSDKDVADTIEYDSESGMYRAYFEKGRDDPSLVIVEAIVAIEGIAPTALEPLENTIDVDALDTAIQSPINDCCVRITSPVQGYQVSVHTKGVIELLPPDPSTTDPDSMD